MKKEGSAISTTEEAAAEARHVQGFPEAHARPERDWPKRDWPKLRSYTGASRRHVSVPVGGIGTGTIGFGGRAEWRDWEIENRPSRGTDAPLTFLACRAQVEGADPLARVLEGDLWDDEAEGELGSPVPWAGLPRFSGCRIDTCYPFAAAVLTDPAFPLAVEVEVWNPLAPADPELSGWPLACIRVSVTNHGSRPVSADVLLSVEDLVGHRIRAQHRDSDPVIEARSGAGLRGCLLGDDALDPTDEAWGTLAAGVLDDGWVGSLWDRGKWDQGMLALWRSFSETGRPDTTPQRAGEATTSGRPASLAATLGASRLIRPGHTETVQLLIAWHFPNRRNWEGGLAGPAGRSGNEIVGNHYTLGHSDAWEILASAAADLERLRARTVAFVDALVGSDLPETLVEAALANLSTLRTNTVFRTADGLPFGWEGCLDQAGSCLGSCTHVWNYDLATPFVFGSLARSMREIEYLHATDDQGAMSFRVMLPLERAQELRIHAADGQFGCVLKAYREWTLSGDSGWLRQLWPALRRSIEFAWIPGGWDADRDGVAEGAQHNTTDVEYYGPNPVVQGWYLAALQAAAVMGSALGDDQFAGLCAQVLVSGKTGTEQRLWNGAWYRQEILPPGDFAKVAPTLRIPEMGGGDPVDPEYQIGEGCILDQLVGDTYARLLGLDPIYDPERARIALDSIEEHNHVADLGHWSNGMRTYGGRGEQGHIFESYPDGFPCHPMPYWSEVWSGLEYVYSIGLLLDGEAARAEDVVRQIRQRYDGRRRNPFDETECGHHYVRPMASWGLLVAASGFRYDGTTGHLSFADPAARPMQPGNPRSPRGHRGERAVNWFWSNGDAWGTVDLDPDDDHYGLSLKVLGGQLRVSTVTVGDRTIWRGPDLQVLGPEEELTP